VDFSSQLFGKTLADDGGWRTLLRSLSALCWGHSPLSVYGRLVRQQLRDEWLDRHNREMALVIALERLGYSRDRARGLVFERNSDHRVGDNGGPVLDE
jgi:hypothetical protein